MEKKFKSQQWQGRSLPACLTQHMHNIYAAASILLYIINYEEP